MRLLDKINTDINAFSKTEKKLVSYIQNNKVIIYQTINEVMEESKVGYGTVIRFCKKLGCSGFQDFKIRLASEGFTETRNTSKRTLLLDDVKEKVSNQTEITLRNIKKETLDNIVTEIEKAKHILIIGIAGSFPTALELTYRLTRLGFSSVIAESDEDMQALRASLLKEDDLLFIFSYSGMTKSILRSAELAKRQKTRIVAITNYTKSPLTNYTNYNLVTTIQEQALEAEIGTRLPFYMIIELITTSLINRDKKYSKAIKSTYRSVSDSQI